MKTSQNLSLNAKGTPLYIGLSASIIVAFILSLRFGDVEIHLMNELTQLFNDQFSIHRLILQEVRLPRTLLALIVGASLGLSGAALQGLIRNPLAEPGVIGVSSSAALGAVFVFYFGLAGTASFFLPLGGILGALMAVIFLYGLAGRSQSIISLVLAGVAISSLASALTALALNLSPNPYASLEIYFWLMGSFSNRSFDHVYLILIPTLLGWFLILNTRSELDTLTLGEQTASSMGVNLRQTKFFIISGVALCVGAAVSVSGGIGFIGLIVPHLLRPYVQHQAGKLLALSALGGALLLLCADLATRLIPTEQELKIGVLTALLGAPLFLRLILQTRREGLS